MDLFLISQRVILILVAAGGYAIAAILMKLSATTGPLQGILGGIAIVLLLTVLAEIALLRQMELSNVYVAILAIETLLVIGYALLAGEHLSQREIAGGVLVLAGTVLVST